MSRIINLLAIVVLSACAVIVWKQNERLRGFKAAFDLCIAQPPCDAAPEEFMAEMPQLPELPPISEPPLTELAPPVLPQTELPLAATPEPAKDDPFNPRSFIAETRLHAVSQLMELSPAEREALQSAFAQAEPGARTADVIEGVLGAERANHFRGQVRDVFARAKQREEDREVFYYARTLQLSAEQEQSFRTTISDVERSLAELDRDRGVALTPREQLSRMRSERDMRAALMRERAQQFLSAEQYQAFLAEQSASPAFELELFHEIPSEDEEPGTKNSNDSLSTP